MPAPVAVRPRETLKQSLPALDIGPDHSTSSALGPDHVRADVRLWDTFEDEVRGWFIDGQGIDWARLTHTMSYRPQAAPGSFNTLREHVGYGDEGGVEGRIQANIGQPVSAVYKAAGMGLKFGDRDLMNGMDRAMLMRLRNRSGKKSRLVCITPYAFIVGRDSRHEALLAERL